MRREQVEKIDYCVCDDLPTLVWLANLADLELHPSLSLADDIQRPTVMAFDLDPGAGRRPAGVLRGGVHPARRAVTQLGLESFAKTSGSKGIQVYVPLNIEDVDYDHGTKPLSHALARHLEAQHPKLIVSQQKKELRKGKVLIDWSQNDEHKTTVGVYSLRARERPTVSTPRDLGGARATRTVARVRGRPTCSSGSSEHGDLFAPVAELRAGAAGPMRIREVVLPAADPAVPAAFHPERYGSTRVRFEPGPAVCSHFAVNVPPTLRGGRRLGARAGRADPGGRAVPALARPRRLLLRPGRQPRRADRARARARGRAADRGERGRAAGRRRRARRSDFLEAELGLPHFSGDRENFSAVGDDRGLFILVPVGRAWLFTDRPAATRRCGSRSRARGRAELRVPGSAHVIEVASS